MARWRESIELNKVVASVSDEFDLTRLEEDCPEEAKSRLAAEVEKSSWLRRHGKRLREARSIAEVNRILESVFEDADRHLIWCGLPF